MSHDIRFATMRLGDDPISTQSRSLVRQCDPACLLGQRRTDVLAEGLGLRSRHPQAIGRGGAEADQYYDECWFKTMTGTDSGGDWVIPGVSLHQGFDLLQQADLTPLRVLQMTTFRRAEFLKRESTSGTVDEGKDANLVLLDGNPVERVGNPHGIHTVIRGGADYSRQALAELKKPVCRPLSGR